MDMQEKSSYWWIMREILKQRKSLVHLQTTWNHMIHNNKFNMKKIYMKMRYIDNDQVTWNHIFYGDTARPRAMMTL